MGNIDKLQINEVANIYKDIIELKTFSDSPHDIQKINEYLKTNEWVLLSIVSSQPINHEGYHKIIIGRRKTIHDLFPSDES